MKHRFHPYKYMPRGLTPLPVMNDTPDDTAYLGDGRDDWFVAADGGEEVISYSESSPFVRLLKNRGRVKMLDVLLRRPSTKFSSQQWAELANISEPTVSRNKGALIDLGIITPEAEYGKTYYQLNLDNEVVKELGQFHTKLLAHHGEIIKKTKEPERGLEKQARERLRGSEIQEEHSLGENLHEILKETTHS